MTRQELSQVYYLKKELKMWEDKLQTLREKSLTKSKEITDMPFANTGETSDEVFQIVSQIMELQADIEVFRLNIEKKISEIEQYIMTLDDSLMRQIIEYRCCQLKSWRDVSALIGYGTTEESVKHYFNRKYPKK